MMGRLLAALLTASAGCAHKPPQLPEIADRRPDAIRIYVVTPFSDDDWRPSGWYSAAQFTAELETAGFVVALTGQPGEVPPGTPWIDGVTRHVGATCENWFTPLVVLSLGVIPAFDCDGFGTRFDLHASAGAAARTIDTGAEVPTIEGWLAIPIGLPFGYVPGLFRMPSRSAGDYPIRALRTSILNALDAP